MVKIRIGDGNQAEKKPLKTEPRELRIGDAVTGGTVDKLLGIGTDNILKEFDNTLHTHSNIDVLNGITSEKVSNWDAASSWGNHATEGYLKSITDQYIGSLADVDTTTPPTNGQALVWNSVSSKWKPGDVTIDIGDDVVGSTANKLLYVDSNSKLQQLPMYYYPASGLYSTVSLGINVVAPGRKLEVLDGVDPQLRLSYSAGVFTEFQTNISGFLSIAPYGKFVTVKGSTTPTGIIVNSTNASTNAGSFVSGQNLVSLRFASEGSFNIQGQSSANILAGSGSALSTYLTILGSGLVGIGTSNPNSTALVDITSTSKGLLIPRMTGAQVEGITTPADWLMVVATSAGSGVITSKGLWVYNGTTWKQINLI
ncbi:MAG: hypothetical protein GC192_23535 [Bacteroidetes bacterium]|nr:hypothetical protein [Bacteroidota bacterium]